MTLKPGCDHCEHVADVRGIDLTQPTPEAAVWDETCRTPRVYPGMVMACQQCAGCRIDGETIAFIRDAIHRDGPDADAIRETLGLRREWAATDRTSVDLEMWPKFGYVTRQAAEEEFICDGDDVLVCRLSAGDWREVQP